MWGLLSLIKSGLIETTTQFIDFADWMARFKLIFSLNMFSGLLVTIALGSIVLGAARLINLQRMIPSPTFANKSSSESGLIGSKSATWGSSFK